MAEIRLVDLNHQYSPGGAYALKDVNLTWDDGGAYALLGPSGCGKTTMLNIISGLVRPSEGAVMFNDVDVAHTSTAARDIAQVFQFPVIYESMTVRENLEFPLRNRGISKRDASARAVEIAELLQIDHMMKRRAQQLTADAKQLVSLARALVRREVSAILFDEPLTVIDPQKKWELRQALKRVHAELNHTLVYVTHDQTEALTFADEVVVMNAGGVMQKGTPVDLFEQPSNTFVGNFIGSPGMNFFSAMVENGVASLAGTKLLEVPSAGQPNGDPSDVIGVRPEYVRWHDTPGDQRIPVTVTKMNDLGTAVMATFTVEGMTGMARLPISDRPESGPGWVSFSRLQLFRDENSLDNCKPIGLTEGTGRA